MITLAIDASTKTLGIAFLDRDAVIAEIFLGEKRHHAETMLPAIEDLCRLTEMTPEMVGLLVCTTGPGSFTGLRIAVSTIKGMALALGKPVVGVSTLEALAMSAHAEERMICSVMDARKGQIYAALYQKNAEGFPEAVMPDVSTNIENLLHELPKEKIAFVGDGAVRYREIICRNAFFRCDSGTGDGRGPEASIVGKIGYRRYMQGYVEDLLHFTPRYLRLSEAESKSKP